MKNDLIRTIESRAFRAWPALEVAHHAGWLLRASAGYTKRANSANAFSQGTYQARELITAVEQFYGERRQSAVFRLTPLADARLDDILHAAGYAFLEPSLVMQVSLENVSCDPEGSDDIVLRTGFDPTWSAAFAAATGMGEADHLIHDRMLAAITPIAVFATIEPTAAPGRPHAFALAVADEGMVGIFDVLVDARMRRRGLGRKLVQALMAWGKTQDAHSAYLQVGGHNNEAISLYQQLGFRTVYPYHYRRKALPTSA